MVPPFLSFFSLLLRYHCYFVHSLHSSCVFLFLFHPTIPEPLLPVTTSAFQPMPHLRHPSLQTLAHARAHTHSLSYLHRSTEECPFSSSIPFHPYAFPTLKSFLPLNPSLQLLALVPLPSYFHSYLYSSHLSNLPRRYRISSLGGCDKGIASATVMGYGSQHCVVWLDFHNTLG